MNISLCEHKSGQMLQGVKQSLTWVPEETFYVRFPVQSALYSERCAHICLAPLKIQMFGGQTFMFEPTLNLFSRYVSTVRSKRRYHSSRVCVDVAGRDSCRFKELL